MKRIILEMGMGNDLYGEDYTKAACRAVEDAIRHSSLILFLSLGFDHADMQVKVTIGVQQPDRVDTAMVAQKLPRGKAEVTAVKGGLNVVDADNNTCSVVATAAVEAYLNINPNDWVISQKSAASDR
ncbi:MAG: Lin0512 family protein [Proteobacteria bacterium]|nr:Lin0512 family protein [Pseudomonadota bacterium]MDA0846111.1 Lin0512 family protein [Pseudomonadota bacterium]